MTDTPARTVPGSRSTRPAPGGWVGWLAYAGIMLIMVGTFEVIDGLVALFNDDFYLVRPNGLVVDLDFTTWGWVHLLVGLLLIAAGVAVFSGRTWARIVGVIAALLSMVVNFAFLPAYPFWSVLMITVDGVVVYALIAHGGELRRSSDEYY